MRLETHATVQTPGYAQSRLDSELSGILHSKSFQNESEKWLAYQGILEKYLQNRGVFKAREQIRPPEDVDSQFEEEEAKKKEEFDMSLMLQSVKKTYRSKARQLADFIKRSSNIAWTKSGRLVIDGVELPDSNINLLINDAMRYRSKSRVPNARAQLSAALRKAGVSQKLIGNRNFWEDGETSQLNITGGNVAATSSPKQTSKNTTPPSSTTEPSTSSNQNNHNRTWFAWRP